MTPTIKLGPSLGAGRFVYARSAVAAAALLVAGHAIHSVIFERGHPVYRFPETARPALKAYLDALTHARAVAERTAQETNPSHLYR